AYGQIALSNAGPFGWNVTTPATFVDGVLRQSVVVDTPGVEQLEVQLPGGFAYDYTDDFQVFSPVDHFEIEPVGAVSVGVPFDLVMTAKDASNATITPFTGRVVLTSTGALSPAISANFVNGTLAQPVTFLSTGPHTITVTLEGGTASGTTDTFLASPGPLDHFVFDPIAPQTAGVPFQLRIEARDLGGNLTPYAGTAALRTESGAPVSPATTGAFTAGVLTQTVTLNEAGSVRIIAEDGAASGMSDAFTVSAEGVLDHFTIAPVGGSRVAGVPFAISITARDRFGNALTSFSGTASLSTNGGAITPPVTPPFASGVATMDVTLTLAGARSITAASGGATGTGNTFTLDPGPAAQFAITTSASPVAGVPFALALQALDAYGNAASGFSGTVALGVDAGTISPLTSNPFTGGMLTQDVTVTGAGARTISATAGPATGSGVIAVSHAALDHFTFAAV
ncbi:MAG TPA: hypothetical protein VFV33_10190, partial [Gemmatimonadaceae bacterium]|nr:hypothetical protein [Gemmatimonadaceae bacterium]